MKNYFELIIVVIICMIYYIGIECRICSREAGHCEDNGTSIDCYIDNNASYKINILLRDCVKWDNEQNTIRIYKQYIVEIDDGGFMIELDLLPSNIQTLILASTKDDDKIYIESTQKNYALTRITSQYHVQVDSKFFDYFSDLQCIDISYIHTNGPLSFTKLSSLTFLRAAIFGTDTTHTFDATVVSGLSNLEMLILSHSYYHGIINGALRDLNKLTYLNFDSNNLRFIEDNAFRNLTSLKRLYLSNNMMLSNISHKVFQGLTGLTYVYLDNIPGFPIKALKHTKSLVEIYLRNNGYQTLNPHVFQQMDSLNVLYLEDPFICNCSLRWTSRVKRYDLLIRDATCSEPSTVYRKPITTRYLYRECHERETYRCFDKSISCHDNKTCYNNGRNYSCDCSKGFALDTLGVCNDINECNGKNYCEYACVNTEGSFYCVCKAGYQLARNKHSCEDENECLTENGGCPIVCLNTIGSFECLNPWPISSIVLVAVSAVLNIALVVVIIMSLLICIIRKMKKGNILPDEEGLKLYKSAITIDALYNTIKRSPNKSQDNSTSAEIILEKCTEIQAT